MDKRAQTPVNEYSVPFLESNEYNVPFLGEDKGTNTKPTSTVGYTAPSSLSAVKAMQRAILDFGAALSAHPIMSMQEAGAQERQRARGETDYLGGTNPFGKFLTDQYVNNADVVGKQFVNIDLMEPTRSQTAISNQGLKGVVNTINRVGTPGKEHEPDGIWQTRTNNALKQIYAVGAALMQFAKDVNVDIKGFSDSQLAAFKKLIPDSYTDIKINKEEIAKELTKYIVALTDLYKKFESAILENPEYKAIINQDKPIADHSQQHKMELDPNEQTFYEANKDAVVPGAVVNGKPVRLMDIVSMTAFTKFLQSANLDVSRPEVVKKQLASIKNLIAAGGVSGAGF